MQKIVDDNDDCIAELKSEINNMADTKASLEDKINSCEHMRVRLESEAASVGRIVRELSHSLSVITNENGDILKNIEDIENQSKSFNQKILDNEEKIKLSRKSADEFTSKAEEVVLKRDAFQESILTDRISLSTIDKDIEVLHADIYSSSANKNSLFMELSAKENDIKNTQKQS